MSEQSKIQWCDSTVNFWSGCTKVSDGCKHCYAEARDARQMQEKKSHWGKGAARLKTKGAVKDALRYNRLPWICEQCDEAFQNEGAFALHSMKTDHTKFHRRRIFSLSLGDWLDEEVPIEWFVEMLDTIRQCDQCNWLLLTKRPENFADRLRKAHDFAEIHKRKELVEFILALEIGNAPKNIWIGTSTENQETADKRIPYLLKIPARIRFLSVEPMLGPIDLRYASFNGADSLLGGLEGIDWVIFGGESGPNARLCNVEWIREGVEQCRLAGLKPFVKQLGAKAVAKITGTSKEPTKLYDDGWLKDKKGGDINEWPEDLRVREFPV